MKARRQRRYRTRTPGAHLLAPLFSGAALALLLLAPGAGCSDNRSVSSDASLDSGKDAARELGGDLPASPDGPGMDMPVSQDMPMPFGDGSLAACSSGCYDYIFDRVLLPGDTASTEKYALMFKGKQYNSLGGILSLIAQISKDVDLQKNSDETTCSGTGLHLLRLQTKSLTSASGVYAQSWPSTAKCCTAANCISTQDKTKCVQAAVQTCFSGSNTHKAGATSGKLILAGGISAGKLNLGYGKAVLAPLSFYSSGSMVAATFTLVGAVITGTVSKTGIAGGVLAGGITKSEIDGKLFPTMAASFDKVYKDPATDTKTKSFMKTLFDTNQDGTITTAELAANSMLQKAFAGDVDLDGDGVKELSVGVGFSAVAAKIQAP